MAGYRIDFMNHSNRVFRAELFEANNDDHARELARQLYRSGIGRGYRIWAGERHVHTEIYR